MIKLKETTAFGQVQLPVTLAGCSLRVLPPARITGIAPFPGHETELRALLGAFPAPGEVLIHDPWRLVWAARDLAFAFGESLPDGVAEHAALTDQSDGWCGLELQGKGAETLLGRRLPVDIRKLPPCASVRSLMDHIPVLILRMEVDTFEIWSWRSMAASLVQKFRT